MLHKSTAAAAAIDNNAGASTGPRTPAGKAISSQNALKHGLASDTMIIAGESATEWEEFRDGMFAEWQPTTPTEEAMVGDMAKHQWLKDRAIRLQNHEMRLFGVEVVSKPAFMVLLRYQTTNERAFARAMKQLESLRKSRATEFVSQSSETVAEPSRPTTAKQAKIRRVPPPEVAITAEIGSETNGSPASNGPAPAVFKIAS